jgi:hypothetical protein
MANRSLSAIETELLRQELKALRDRNLMESTFGEITDLIAKLGIRVLPSEDLKSRKIFCRLNLVTEVTDRLFPSFLPFSGSQVTLTVMLLHRLKCAYSSRH